MQRSVRPRTGLALARDGGALPQMALPFRFFVGGPVGTGRQYMSWISVEDWTGIVLKALSSESLFLSFVAIDRFAIKNK